ncbi:MAG TPA: SIS domain-containing protein [Longimicrobiales bacterium]
MTNPIAAHLTGLSEVATRAANELSTEVLAIADVMRRCIAANGKLMFCGNGGSAADAQHMATEYVVRFRRNRRPVAAIALTTDTSLLTAASNDFGFDQVFERQVRALGRPGDVLFLHSTSGESENLVRAAMTARDMGVHTVALLARGGGRLKGVVDTAIVVPTDNGAHAQELHLAISHALCDLLESELT